MISQHEEIEAKLDAGGVDFGDFDRWVWGDYLVRAFRRVSSPDDYYENGDFVVRHRHGRSTSPHELTVKRRHSEDSTRTRLEVDLHFAQQTRTEDVRAFLEATGFKLAFTLKKEARIFYVDYGPELQVTIVLYDVWRQGSSSRDGRRFIEIEAEKGSKCTPEFAREAVASLVEVCRTRFGLAEPLNESLYELYSGKRYQVT